MKILYQTIARILENIPNNPQTSVLFPISVRLVDGLKGSGSHQIYSQFNEDAMLSTKNYILFASRVISISDSNDRYIFSNDNPNATFGIRPVALIAQKENTEKIQHLMDALINPAVSNLQEGFTFPQGKLTSKSFAVC